MMNATFPRAGIVPLGVLKPETAEHLLAMLAGIRRMTIHGPGAIQRSSALRTPGAGKARWPGGRLGPAVTAGAFMTGNMAEIHSKQEMDKISISLR
ncbi:MAG: methyl-coenzyme M reductase operon protein D [Methanomicrobiaceae archaeon]|jgi:hypothetical protein|nr:methyl-coenzyme M reductase operon protein D [Methanomicrobiaceae archaeon]